MNNGCDDTTYIKLSTPEAAEWAPAAAILIALTCVFYFSFELRGYNLSTTSLIDPAGVIQVTAWDLFNGRCFKDGAFPLWNPFTGFGQPHLGAMQTAPFYPLKIVAYLFGGIKGHDLYLSARLFFMAFGMFFLLRSVGAKFFGAMFGAIAFGFGGYSLWFANLVDVGNQATTPFLMLAFGLLAERWTPRRYAAASAIVAVDMLGGHPEALFVSLMFSSLFGLFLAGRKKYLSTAAKIAASGFSGALAASIALLPFAEYYPRAWNFHFRGMGFLHLWPRALAPVVSPLFAFLSSGPGWDMPRGIDKLSVLSIFQAPYKTMTMQAGLPYLGLVAFAFAFAGIIRFKRLPRAATFFLLFFLFFCGLSFGLFPFRVLSFIPPFNVMNNAKFYFCELTFSLCAIAGLAADRFFKRGLKLTAAIFTLVIIELILNSFTVKPYVPLNWDKAMRTQWADGLDIGLNGYRFQAGGYLFFPPNFGAAKGFSDIRSSDALFPIEYFRWINQANSVSAGEAIYEFYPRYFTRLNDVGLSGKAAGLMGVKYYVVETPNAVTGFQPLKNDGYYLYERQDVCGRLFNWDAASQYCGESVDFKREHPERLVAELKGASTIIVFNELRYPGWRAYVGGDEIKPANIGVPSQAYDAAGKSGELKIEYKPFSFKIGLWTTLSSCVFLALIAAKRKAAR